MEEILAVHEKSEQFCKELNEMGNDFKKRLHAILHGESVDNSVAPLRDTTNLTPQPEKKRHKRLSAFDENDETNAVENVTRAKNATLLESSAASERTVTSIKRSSARSAQKEAEATTNMKTVGTIPKSASELMPPPLAPVAVSSTNSDQSFTRPQRAAKLHCEKHLKEPPLNSKLRRPSNEEMTSVSVKIEHEHRVSQMNVSTAANRIDSMASTASQDSVVILPSKEVSIVSIASDVEPIVTVGINENSQNTKQNENVSSGKQLRVLIKREKLSISFEKSQNTGEIASNVHSNETETINPESSATIHSTTTNLANMTQNKRGGRKKKAVPKPIKVERISDPGEKSETAVASRTRNKNKSIEKDKAPLESKEPAKTDQRDASVYQEALENLPASENDSATTKQPMSTSAVINETITVAKHAVTPSNEINSTMILGTAPNDATYCTASAATFILETQNAQPTQVEGNDLTFNVAKEKSIESRQSSLQSMETARDTLQPQNDSLITEDESDECPETPVPTVPTVKKAISQAPLAPKVAPKPNLGLLSSAKKLAMPTKACKMPARTIEIFNPLIQSPVKKKVEAYENAAAAQAASSTGVVKRTRSKQVKENLPAALQGSSTTPLIGKPLAPPLGRFLTPTQASNVKTPNAMPQAKLSSASASKATYLTKSSSAGNLKATTLSAKALSRENSAEDFRKGLHEIAEERKKQREQKHLLAAQQREAKERERAERLAKVAKEREEKRLLKQQEAEQRKRELENIQKKLRAQEEAAAAELAKKKAKMLMEQEKAKMRELGASNAKARNPPSQSKIQDKYTFEMLHEDDSTDDENKTSYKRPPPPIWSRSHVRGPGIVRQQAMPTAIVDSFFSVQPMTPDLKTIFPAIDPRHLKRNSSVFWSTPPRYSELPKY